MVKIVTPKVDLGFKAANFNLLGTDNLKHNLESSLGVNGLLVMFICNHCPYVQKIIDEIVVDTSELAQYGIGSIAVMPNDIMSYPQDSLDNMRNLSKQKGFGFPYVIDETQQVAKAYGAVCTPDFFGFNKNMQLRYRGCLRNPSDTSIRELFNAMVEIGKHGEYLGVQNPSEGCSIKWLEH